jgi:hypothetical protein
MSNLLTRMKVPNPRGGPKAKIPVMMEFAVNSETAPYLVTSSEAMTWIEEAMDPTPELWPREAPDSVVRVAVRPDVSGGPGGFYSEVIEQVTTEGQARQWGNIHDYTEDGVLAAINHVRHYEMGDLCLLFPPESRMDTPLDDNPPLPLNEIALQHECLPQPCSWMPDYSAAVVPKDRDFLGSIGFFGRKGAVVIVHNAARALAIAHRPPDPE